MGSNLDFLFCITPELIAKYVVLHLPLSRSRAPQKMTIRIFGCLSGSTKKHKTGQNSGSLKARRKPRRRRGKCQGGLLLLLFFAHQRKVEKNFTLKCFKKLTAFAVIINDCEIIKSAYPARSSWCFKIGIGIEIAIESGPDFDPDPGKNNPTWLK